MKKYAFALFVILSIQSALAQEAIPLFDDIAYEPQKAVKTSPEKTVSVQPAQTAQPPVQTTVAQPTAPTMAAQPAPQKEKRRPRRLGRDAEPLTSISLAPFPNVTIDIDENASAQKKKDTKPKEEPVIAESDLLKRETPLQMTESAKTAAHKIMEQKIRSASLNRHDVSTFKIANIRFGMEPEEVYDELTDLGYTLQRVEKSIPLFRTAYYDEVCREKHHLTILDDIRKCILNYAENNEQHYVFRETYTRPQSRETIQVSYSSPDTENVSFKIVYQNRGDNSLNSSRPNMAKKLQRHHDFWDIVFDTYGLPDENDKLLWGDLETKYMQATMRGSAYDAYIVMEDRLIQDKDYEAAQTEFATLRRPTAFTIRGEKPEAEEETEE